MDHRDKAPQDGILSSRGKAPPIEVVGVHGAVNQQYNLLKEILNLDGSETQTELLATISKYQSEETSSPSAMNTKHLVFQQKIQELKVLMKKNEQEARKEIVRMEEHVVKAIEEVVSSYHKAIETADSFHHKNLEATRLIRDEIQDLKGTIRVYCRVRPLLLGEKSTVHYIGDDGSIIIVNPFKHERKVFSLDKVYGTDVTQHHIYADIQSLVRSVMDGFNVCIFAYGQNGSGKTYTMSGPRGPELTKEETWGVNHRALHDLFQFSKDRADLIKYEISVQISEIYNDNIKDLLVAGDAKSEISLHPVESAEDAMDLLKKGIEKRTVGATALNENSSRSHSILTVHVEGEVRATGFVRKGRLHLIDLAGSERVGKSEVVGERLKEAQHINKSLSALGDVMAALGENKRHVPYRNSKLTRFLEDSLGAHAKALMLVHINPDANALSETISTLRFAERVSKVKLGAARSNMERGQIKKLEDEVLKLNLGLDQLKLDEARYIEMTTCSTVKPRRGGSKRPLKVTDKGSVTKWPMLDEGGSSAGSPKSPSDVLNFEKLNL